MEQEEWKTYPLITDYLVSSLGAIRLAAGTRTRKPWITGKGYQKVHIRKQWIFVHRIVATTFIGPQPSPKHEINHKNGVKTDNRRENLEWVTRLENMVHARTVLDARSGRIKLSVLQVRIIKRLLGAGMGTTTISKVFGVSRSTIKGIKWGKTWKHVVL